MAARCHSLGTLAAAVLGPGTQRVASQGHLPKCLFWSRLTCPLWGPHCHEKAGMIRSFWKLPGALTSQAQDEKPGLKVLVSPGQLQGAGHWLGGRSTFTKPQSLAAPKWPTSTGGWEVTWESWQVRLQRPGRGRVGACCLVHSRP